MRRFFVVSVLGLAVWAQLLGSASRAADVLTVVHAADVTWVEAVADAASSSVEIKILAPSKRGKVLVQRCTFTAAEGATYRCGIEAPKDGERRAGLWVATLVVDKEAVAKTTFGIR